MLELFAKEGDTVAVGGELFKIAVGDTTGVSASAPPKTAPTSTPTPAPALAPKSKESHGSRIPLIKFLGPRNFKSANHHGVQPSAQQTSPAMAAAPSKPAPPIKQGNRIIYESVEFMPKRYQSLPFSVKEIEMINVLLVGSR